MIAPINKIFVLFMNMQYVIIKLHLILHLMSQSGPLSSGKVSIPSEMSFILEMRSKVILSDTQESCW